MNYLNLHCGYSQPRNSIITANYLILAIFNTKLASNNHHQIFLVFGKLQKTNFQNWFFITLISKIQKPNAEVQVRNNNFTKHTLKKKHCRRKKNSQTLALIIAIFSSSLRIVRNSILHRNCQQKAPTKDTQKIPIWQIFLAHSELPHRS